MATEGDWEFGHGLKIKFALEPSRTALVIVDMQHASACRTSGVGKDLAERGLGHLFDWRFTRIETLVLPRLTRLLEFFRGHKLAVLHLAIGSELPDYSDLPECLRPFAAAAGNRVGQPANAFLEPLAPLPGERVIRKTTQSAFNSSSIDAVLRAMGVQYLCFAGVSTNSCVDGTACDAADLNYRCVLVEDCCSATREDHHLAALSSFASQSGRVMTSKELMDELTQARPSSRQTSNSARALT